MTAHGGIPSCLADLPALVSPNSHSTQNGSAPATSRADSSAQLFLPDRRNVSPVAGATVYDEGLGAHGMDTHTEARELAVPGIQGLSSGSRASTVPSTQMFAMLRKRLEMEGRSPRPRPSITITSVYTLFLPPNCPTIRDHLTVPIIGFRPRTTWLTVLPARKLTALLPDRAEESANASLKASDLYMLWFIPGTRGGLFERLASRASTEMERVIWIATHHPTTPLEATSS